MKLFTTIYINSFYYKTTFYAQTNLTNIPLPYTTTAHSYDTPNQLQLIETNFALNYTSTECI